MFVSSAANWPCVTSWRAASDGQAIACVSPCSSSMPSRKCTAGPKTMIARWTMSSTFITRVARSIATILTAHVRKAETERARAKPPASWRAYDCYLQAAEAFDRFTFRSFSAAPLSVQGWPPLASHALATTPEPPRTVGPDAAAHGPLVASCSRVSSLSPAAAWRHHLRQEPDAGNPLVRIRGGGAQ